MSTSRARAWWGLGAFGLLCLAAGCVGPAQPVTTVWQKLGVPQAFLGARDHFTNRSGNFPQCERKPPLLRIADPKNLESPNAAIKAAAAVKAEEDLAPQKIKALKYLAEIGCGCYDEDGKVKDAILSGLADCTPAVRMAAIQLVEATLGQCDDEELEEVAHHDCLHCGGQGCGLCQSERHAQRQKDKELKKLQKKKKEHHLKNLKNLLCQHCQGQGCAHCGGCSECGSCSGCGCNSAGCCGAEVQKKLADMAYGVDDYGCFKEPVPAIREAAARVLEMCPCIPETPEKGEKKKDEVVPEGAEEILPQKQPEAAGTNDTTQVAPTAVPASNMPLPIAAGPVVQVVTPEAMLHNTAYSSPASSRRTSSELAADGSSDEAEQMVNATIESLDLSAQQVVLSFTTDLLIPGGETLLVRLGNGEAQCEVREAIAGRIVAQIVGSDFTQNPQVGDSVKFGVLAR